MNETINFKLTFEQSSTPMVMLNIDFTVLAVSDSYLKATQTTREGMVGKTLFEVFPDNPADAQANGEKGVRDSLHRVLAGKSTDTVAVIKYDIPRPASQGGGFTQKYWRFWNTPVMDEFATIQYIIHSVQDVTENETLIEELKIGKKLLTVVADSEKRYSLLLMKSPFGVAILKGKDMVVTLANESIKKLWGKNEEIEGRRFLDVLPQFKNSPFPALMDKVYTTGVPYYGDEVPARVQRGEHMEELYFNFIYQPYLEADESISGVTVIAYDVTAQVMLNKTLIQQSEVEKKVLAESEIKFRLMMETLPQIAWTNTTEMKVTFFNQRWYEYTGENYQQAEVSQWQHVIHQEDLEDTLSQFSTILKTVHGGGFQTRLKSVNGEYRWHLIRLNPIKDQLGHLDHWVGTATDIQELRMIQQQKDEFISIASHELKTPITSLRLSLELLNTMKNSLSEEMVSQLIERANNSLQKFIVLINDLLNTNKANEGRLQLHKSYFKVADVIENCCSYVRNENKYKIVCEGDQEIKVFADESRIEQIVINFINNAIKYAPVSKVIHVYIKKIPDAVKVSVSDKGPGIPADKLQYVFGRYYQVQENGSPSAGLGLGLYIASEIVKGHHGHIGVESEVGHGSTFWFTLPVEEEAQG